MASCMKTNINPSATHYLLCRALLGRYSSNLTSCGADSEKIHLWAATPLQRYSFFVYVTVSKSLLV